MIPQPPEIDKKIGMLTYLTRHPSINARLRERLSDFIVDEVLMGRRASRVLLGLEDFPSDGPYTYLVVAKFRRVDTRELVSLVARLTGGKVRYAGLKDARALTFQFLSLEGRYRLTTITNGLLVRPVGRCREPISRGMNDGNHFTIVVRGTSKLPEIEAFPNFFSYQRFGLSPPFNHDIGKALIQRRLKEAVSMIEEQGYEVGSATSMRQLADILGRDLLRLYVHAYQSYLFNLLLSKRIEIGLEPVEGDFVLKPSGEISLYPEEGELLLPIVGAMTREARGWLKEAISRLLEREGVKKEMFLFRELPEVSALGGFRKALGRAKDLRIVSREGYVALSFFLEAGSYATSYLRELLKPRDPLAQGFV